jgi:hypothetical protein
MVDQPDNDITWFDAALLCDQLGKRMKDQLQTLRQSA